MFVEFGTVFAVALAAAALVTLLWNLFRSGKSVVDWEITFSMAILFGSLLAWTQWRDARR